MLSIEEIVKYNLDKTGIVCRYQEQFKQFELENGQGVIANGILGTNALEPDPYKWQKKVNIAVIDESFAYHTLLMKRVEQLLKGRLSSAHPDDRAHYQSVLLQIQSMGKE